MRIWGGSRLRGEGTGARTCSDAVLSLVEEHSLSTLQEK